MSDEKKLESIVVEEKKETKDINTTSTNTSSPSSTNENKETKENRPKITYTDMCKSLLQQVECTYPMTHNKTLDVFATLSVQEKDMIEKMKIYADPIKLECNTLCQLVAVWGLTRVRNSSNSHALREIILFLNALQQAHDHLQRACILDSTLKEGI